MRTNRTLSLALVLGIALAGCGSPPSTTPNADPTTAPQVPASTEVGGQVVTQAPAAKFQEAPFLAERVAQGDLPPVDARLPASPRIVAPLIESGEYGGDFRYGFTGNNVGWGGLIFIAGWENLVSWSPDFSSVVPNVAESWEVNDDATQFTFHLRQGMKWSDGQPFTTEDIRFYIEDILFNEEIKPEGPNADWLPSEMQEGFALNVLDETTFSFTFPKPYGSFLYKLCQWEGRELAHFPAHFLKQYHADYNEHVADLVAAEEGVEDWVSLFSKYAAGPNVDFVSFFDLPTRPTLNPWATVQVLGAGTTVILERNAYYWKVDDQGRQLPYVDRIVGTSFQDEEARTLAMLNGDLDCVGTISDDDRALFYDAVDEGKPLQIKRMGNTNANQFAVSFNQTLPDDNPKAGVFRDKNFRIGMSYALNRQEIIEIVFHGQGTPAQVGPLANSPLYNEQLATQYLDFDVALANEYLDKVLPEKDSEGFRLGPDGKRFTVIFTQPSDLDYGASWVRSAELMTGYWAAVGVDVKLDLVPESQWNEVLLSNQLELTISGGEGGAGIEALLSPVNFAPPGWGAAWSAGWTHYYWQIADAAKVEPPAEIQALHDLYIEASSSPDPDQQITLMKQVVQQAADNFFVMGVALPADGGYVPLSSRVGNYIDGDAYAIGWVQGSFKILQPEQWFLRGE